MDEASKKKKMMVFEIALALYSMLTAKENAAAGAPDCVPEKDRADATKDLQLYAEQNIKVGSERVKQLIGEFGLLTNKKFKLSPATVGALCGMLNCHPDVASAPKFRPFLPHEIVPLVYAEETNKDLLGGAIDSAYKAFRDYVDGQGIHMEGVEYWRRSAPQSGAVGRKERGGQRLDMQEPMAGAVRKRTR